MSQSSKSILILGGTGFLGSHLAEKLLAHGHIVKVFSRHAPPIIPSNSTAEFYVGDFRMLDSNSLMFDGVDTIVHCINSSTPTTSIENPVTDLTDNLVSTARLLEILKTKNVKRLLFFSSGGTVYGNSPVQPITESQALNPISPYGVTKAAIEKYIGMKQHLREIDSIVFRPSNPFGPRQGKIGSQGLIATLINNGLKGLTTEIWGDGTSVRDYIYIEDVADAVLKAIENWQSGTYNIASGVGISVKELIELIQNKMKTPLIIKHSSPRAFDVEKLILDPSQAKNILGWTICSDFNKALDQTLEWYEVNSEN